MLHIQNAIDTATTLQVQLACVLEPIIDLILSTSSNTAQPSGSDGLYEISSTTYQLLVKALGTLGMTSAPSKAKNGGAQETADVTSVPPSPA